MSSSSGKQYGLLIRKKPQQQISRKSIFDDSDEDEPESKKVEKLIVKESLKNQVKRKTQVEIQKALNEDPTVYDYDNIYDDIQKKKEIAKAATVPKEKKPRYIESLLKSAEQRKKDNERRIERQIQKERQEEGETYADKDSFVTSSYKKKLQEMQEEEEREQRERTLEEMMDVTKQKDLSGFYRHFLNQTTGEEAIPEFGKRFAPSSSTCPIKQEKMSPVREEAIGNETESVDNNLIKTTLVRDKAKEALMQQRSSRISEESESHEMRESAEPSSCNKRGADSDSTLDSDSSENSSQSKKKSKISPENDSRKVTKKANLTPDHAQTKLAGKDTDSDISSDGGSDSDVNEKSRLKTRDSDSKVSGSTKKDRKTKERHDSSSEGESSNSEKDARRTKSENKQKTVVSSQMRESSDDVQKSSGDVPRLSEKHITVDSDSRASKDTVAIKRRIFEKRTVGNVLLEAKARYLERKEARENARRVFSSA